MEFKFKRIPANYHWKPKMVGRPVYYDPTVEIIADSEEEAWKKLNENQKIGGNPQSVYKLETSCE
ncbi:MAG: hypothetical protein OEX08_02925 [Candidatus Nomurabacteria bacterium]|nr:hypothetical protein [Candidatus Nomurabacteria bacterium]